MNNDDLKNQDQLPQKKKKNQDQLTRKGNTLQQINSSKSKYEHLRRQV